jgi:hypothetical protein
VGGRSLLALAVAAMVAAAFGAGLLVGRDRSTATRVVRLAQPVTVAVPVSSSTLHAILTPYNVRGFDAHDVDLADVVPRDGAVDGVWFVPAGTTVPQLAVAWHRGRGEARLWNLTLWTPEKARNPGTRWRPQRLITRSPIPILDWEGNAGVRLADVTGDRHDDLLVALGIPGSNHVATLVSVFSGAPPYHRIYGFGYQEVDKRGRQAFGRLISETEWGARDGLLWFKEPRGGRSVCCPDYFLRYELRWNGHGWDRVSERRIRRAYG